MKLKKMLSIVLIVIFICMYMMCGITATAAYYTETIYYSGSGNILDIVLNNEGNDAYAKGYYLFYNSAYAAAYNKTFPYPNSGGYVNSIFDNGTTYSIPGAAGCMAYAEYVSAYVYGGSSNTKRYICSTAGDMTADDVKSVITSYAQLGETIRIGTIHAIVFIAYDSNGFYYTDYMNDSDPCIYIHYTTWAQFKSECNSKKVTVWIYEANSSANDNSNTVAINALSDSNTITDTNAVLYAWVDKPSSASISKIGIRVRKDGDTYSNGWSRFDPPSQNYVGYDGIKIWFDMNGELGITLIPATKYWFQFYAKVNDTEYWSVEYYFTTTGTPTLNIKYDANGGYINSEKSSTYALNGSGLIYRVSGGEFYTTIMTYGVSHANGFVNASTLGLTRDGYTFKGWSLSAAGGTVYSQTGARYPEDIYPDLVNGSATITMYAVWEPYVLTIQYNSNGGYISESKSTVHFLNDESIVCKFSTNACYSIKMKYKTTFTTGFTDDTTLGIVKDGYSFVGWSLSASGGTVYSQTGARYPEDIYPDLVNGSATVTMYAVWNMFADINYDNEIDVMDLVRLKKIIAGVCETHNIADLDGDETVNSVDLSILKSKILKQEKSI